MSVKKIFVSFVLVSLLVGVQTERVLADAGPQTLEEARTRLRNIEREELEARTEIDIVNAEDARVSDAFNSATILLERQRSLVEDVKRQLAKAHDVFAQADAEVKASEAQLAAHRELAKDIAVTAYLEIQGDRDELLFSSSDLNEGIKKQAILDIISTSVGDFRAELRLIEDENRIAKEIANRAFLEVVANEVHLNEELKVLEADQVRLAMLRTELEKRRAELQALVDQYEQENAEIEAFIRQRESQVTAAINLGFTWPTAGALGGGFGQRFHPILKYWRSHNGIDIRGVSGQSIVAAHSGTVILSTSGSGFGNYIILDRGDGLTSVYAHMSRRLVVTGENVEVGDEIGRVGSTGLSTGPHLHFEIRESGTPVNPLNHLPPR